LTRFFSHHRTAEGTGSLRLVENDDGSQSGDQAVFLNGRRDLGIADPGVRCLPGRDHHREMILNLLPTSCSFQRGNRIRLAVAFVDDGNFDTPLLDPPPTLKLLRHPDYSCYMVLPVKVRERLKGGTDGFERRV
jgi:hypothetical protein